MVTNCIGNEGSLEINGEDELLRDTSKEKEEDHYDTRSEVSSSDDEDQISNPSLSSASFKSESGK